MSSPSANRLNHFEISRRYGSTLRPCSAGRFGGMISASVVSGVRAGLQAIDGGGHEIDHEGGLVDSILLDAFAYVHHGFSVDRVLCDPALTRQFVAKVRGSLGQIDEGAILRRLISMRKRPRSFEGSLPPTTNRSKLSASVRGRILPAVELAVSRMRYEARSSIDDILVVPRVREDFDRLCSSMVRRASRIECRLTALYIRKDLHKFARHKSVQARASLDMRKIYRRFEDAGRLDSLDLGGIPEDPGIFSIVYGGARKKYVYVASGDSLRPAMETVSRRRVWESVSGGFWDLPYDRLRLEYLQASKIDEQPIRMWADRLIEVKNPVFNYADTERAA